MFYRGSALTVARRLGLSGWARNCSDGSVELMVCGTPRALDELEAWLWKGPSQARVESVVRETAAVQDFADFQVRS